MKILQLGLVFLGATVSLVAGPLTFTFAEYQVDPTTIEKGGAFPLAGLEGLKASI